MTTTSEYQKQAQDFLESCNVDFSYSLIGNDCPRFCDDARKGIDMDKVDKYPRRTHIHGKHYRVKFTKKQDLRLLMDQAYRPIAPLVTDFWNSYADEEFNALGTKAYQMGETMIRGKKRIVTPYDVLSCLVKSDPDSFESFCADYGYDPDSRRAEETYRLVREEWVKVRQFFTSDEIERLQEIQ